jgi:hypothetical protein
MPKAVVILGAGASADFGVPILRNLFKDGHARSFLKIRRRALRSLNELFWGPRGHSIDTSDQSLTIEEMLTILRDWEQEPTCRGALDKQETAYLRRVLYVVIQRAVFVGKSSGGRHLNDLINTMSRQFDLVTWASFNWDCIFEASYWYCRKKNPRLAVDLQDWTVGTTRINEFLKLHGGINWWKVGGRLHYVSFGRGGDLSTKWSDYADGNAEGEPVILEPSVYKYTDENYDLLKGQWDHFMRRLCETDCVLVLGYSLPEADSQARSKLTVAFQVNSTCRWLVVDPSEETCRRYKRLLGETAVTTQQTGLAGFNNELKTNLQNGFPNVDFS